MKATGNIRSAVPADLPLIHEWLKQEGSSSGGFINNWGMIQDACAEQEMIVFAAAEGPVGFITRGLSLSTIIQTKSTYQRKGIGRALVEHALAEEEAKGNAVVVLQCAPESSVEFWLAMGFEAHRYGNHTHSVYMQRLSKAKRAHVQGDDLSLVTITVYPQAVLYSNDIKPDRVHYVMGKFDYDTRTLDLAHRVSIASESKLGDQVVEIDFGGNEIYRGKAKRTEAAAVGLKPTPNYCGWYLDVIYLDGNAR